MEPPYMVNHYLKTIIDQIPEEGFAVHLFFFAKPRFIVMSAVNYGNL